MSIECLRAKTQSLFPVRGANASMEAGECRVREDGLMLLTVRLMTYDGEQIRDIKEQEIYFVHEEIPDERLELFLEGWVLALRTVLDAPRETIDYYMPHDLFAADVIKLKKAQAAEDFAAAFLTKKRLGAVLSGT